MDKKVLIEELTKSAEDGTLLIPKHDPNNLSTICKGYRTVLSFELASNLDAFIKSGCFDVKCYEDKRNGYSKDYYEIIIKPNSTFTVPASGVGPLSPIATSQCDRLVAVCGFKTGWHLFGEDSIGIETMVNKGDLVFAEELND